MLYRERLLATVEGRELPTELPKIESPSTTSAHGGSDPLPGETEAQYVARQRALQEEAKERMRLKFGGSSGLSSGGKSHMQGIGSDAGYRPGSSSSSSTYMGAIDTKMLGDQLSEASNTAFSFVSSVWESTSKTVQEAKIADQVQSTWQQLLAQNETSQRNNLAGYTQRDEYSADQSHSGSSMRSTKANQGEDDPLAASWSALSTGAMGFWKQAATVTSTFVQALTEEEEQAMKFPRGRTDIPDKPASDGNIDTRKSTVDSNDSQFSGAGSGLNMTKNDFDLDNIADAPRQPSRPPRGTPSKPRSTATSQSTNHLVGSNSSPDLMNTSTPPRTVNAAVPVAPRSTGGIESSRSAAPKKDDDADFFASFGVK